ncbi:MAG: DUF3866 family protein [Peptococcaceae bacterium]|nr:DUF3866 family protein [Peptococcaceae bacterium]
MIRFRRGVVTAILGARPGVTEVMVNIGGREEMALNYDLITGGVAAGDRVILNTTAVARGLGTGGYHFVAAVEGKNGPDPGPRGHIMKLRYTPFQVKVLAVEEEEHPENRLYRTVKDLGGMPVVIGSLHSMAAPAAAALKRLAGPGARIFYLMTDGGALPVWFSRLAHELKAKKLIDATVTCGHAFGGDYEAINIYSGLLWSRAAGADAAVVAMGPGIVGSSTEFGHTGLEQGEIVNAVNILGGRAVAIPRVSFADPRERHRGLSHHTRTALGKVALTPCTVTVPAWRGEKRSLIFRQMKEAGIFQRHRVVEVDTSGLPGIMGYFGLNVTTMGRRMEEDPEFFHAAGAAGIYAAGLLQQGADKLPDRGESSGMPAQDGNQVGRPAGKEKPVSGAV